MWRPLHRVDAAWLDPALTGIEPYLAQMTRLALECCTVCEHGTPCNEAMRHAQKEAMPTRKRPSRAAPPRTKATVHYLYALDAADHECLLVYDPGRRFHAFFRQYLFLESHYDQEIEAWYVDSPRRQTILPLERHELFQRWCADCQACGTCSAWSESRLREEGYKPRTVRGKPRRLGASTVQIQAIALLGVSATASRQEIETAFRKKALRMHPDHGGSDAQMHALIQARKHLISGE